MSVYEFCRNNTQAYQLCVIHDSGWIVGTVWIDPEDLFRIPNSLAEAEVINTEFGVLPVKTKHGDTVHIPCLHIYT